MIINITIVYTPSPSAKEMSALRWVLRNVYRLFSFATVQPADRNGLLLEAVGTKHELFLLRVLRTII
jgi:hypothetical protein